MRRSKGDRYLGILLVVWVVPHGLGTAGPWIWRDSGKTRAAITEEFGDRPVYEAWEDISW